MTTPWQPRERIRCVELEFKKSNFVGQWVRPDKPREYNPYVLERFATVATRQQALSTSRTVGPSMDAENKKTKG